MIISRHINKIIAAVVLFAVLAIAFILYAAVNNDESQNIPEYQKKLFGDKIAEIDIRADAKDWQNLVSNAPDKDWISCDIAINGEVFNGVGIRTKGNSSLIKTENLKSGRYSLNIKFNKYVKGQTYYGLDTFSLNNMIDDATYMKEYISYDIMQYIGVPAPLKNYAKVTINGNDYGFLLILERYDEAFLERVYGTSSGQMYNVKNTNANNAGGSLLYAGNDAGSYSSIFDNAVFGKKSDKHDKQVIAAIEHLNTGINIEKYWDADEILRYFAANTAVVNLKSYVSNQEQNYYLYVRDNKVAVLPWSYHLSFGGYPKDADASMIVNFPIDEPVYGVNMQERPLLNKLLEFPEYKAKYHEYLRRITDGYFNGGLFEETVNKLNGKIGGYVKTDVSGFYTYEQYEKSLPTLIELVRLRAESIEGQLNGTIPSTLKGQNNVRSTLINASKIDLSALR